ncbi:RDD family protein [Cryptosporangium phraense]|uniref:RDD family protein n=1 Tax=Cryptosporangium phraense TaxID=2593070 RepID=UPI001F0D9FC0|nr:RDD family protein [Cryptosporangium phraense]
MPPGHIRVPGSTATMPLDTTKLAPLGLRVVARLIDLFAVFLLCIVVNGYFYYQFAQEVAPVVNDVLLGKEALSSEATRLNWIIILLTIGLWFAYEVPATANSGQTLGKRLVGIRVVRVVDDQTLTFGQSIRRWLILALPSPATSFPCGVPLQLADLLWCTWDRPGRQCLHDKAVTSIVVRSSAVPIAPSQPTDKE